MRDLLFLALFLALPALAVLGHDVYLAYNNVEVAVSDRFYLSDIGWLWVTYSPDSYHWAIENTDTLVWNNVIDPLLQQTAFYIFVTPFSLLILIMIVMKITGTGAFEGSSLFGSSRFRAGKKNEFSFDKTKDKKTKPVKYKSK